MKAHTAFLAFSVSIAITAAQAGASAPVSNPAGAIKNPSGTSSPQLAKIQAPDASPGKSHTFRVVDEKGLLLTCVAPQIETNADTDVFEDCVLAPGRTLNELMHSFVGAIHVEQNQHAQEHAEWIKELEEKSDREPAKK